VTSQETILHL